MSLTLKTKLAKISQLSQRQDSGLEQLRDLHAFTNKLGLYDAADLIKNLTSTPPLNGKDSCYQGAMSDPGSDAPGF